MPVEIEIPEASITGFSDPARECLKDTLMTYASDVIDEANRLEAGSNSASGPPEVTRSMVKDAELFVRRRLGTPKRGLPSRALGVAAVVLPLAVGVAYDKHSLQTSSGYLLGFILLLAIAVLAVTLSKLRE